jgi:hypothetical protein
MMPRGDRTTAHGFRTERDLGNPFAQPCASLWMQPGRTAPTVPAGAAVNGARIGRL